MSRPRRDNKTSAGAPRRSGGFTLVELMITLAVLVVVVRIAYPSYRDFLLGNRRSAATNDLIGAIGFARAQAITLRPNAQSRVVLCRIANPAPSPPACVTTTGTGWESGWIVFLDVNGNGSYDPNVTPSPDQLLRQQDPINPASAATGAQITIRGGNATGNLTRDVISFNRYGQPSSGGAIAVCDPRGWGTKAAVVTLSTGGQARSVTTSQQSTISTCTP